MECEFFEKNFKINDEILNAEQARASMLLYCFVVFSVLLFVKRRSSERRFIFCGLDKRILAHTIRAE